MPSRLLTMDPTRKDAGASSIAITILYDPLTQVIQVKGGRGLDIVGLLGLLELAKHSVLNSAMRRPT
jgi:hypothetical protein